MTDVVHAYVQTPGNSNILLLDLGPRTETTTRALVFSQDVVQPLVSFGLPKNIIDLHIGPKVAYRGFLTTGSEGQTDITTIAVLREGIPAEDIPSWFTPHAGRVGVIDVAAAGQDLFLETFVEGVRSWVGWEEIPTEAMTTFFQKADLPAEVFLHSGPINVWREYWRTFARTPKDQRDPHGAFNSSWTGISDLPGDMENTVLLLESMWTPVAE